MDSEYIQSVRYKLQKRLKRLGAARYNTLHWSLVQAWGFLQENEITKGILDDLEQRVAPLEAKAEKGSQLLVSYVTKRLTIDGSKGAGIQLAMIWNC